MAITSPRSHLSTIRPAEFLQRHGVFVRRARAPYIARRRPPLD